MDWHALGWLALALYAGAEVAFDPVAPEPGGASRAPSCADPASLLLGAGLARCSSRTSSCRARALHSVPYRTLRRVDVALRMDARRLLPRAPLPAPRAGDRPVPDPVRHPLLGWPASSCPSRAAVPTAETRGAPLRPARDASRCSATPPSPSPSSCRSSTSSRTARSGGAARACSSRGSRRSR